MANDWQQQVLDLTAQVEKLQEKVDDLSSAALTYGKRSIQITEQLQEYDKKFESLFSTIRDQQEEIGTLTRELGRA